MLNKQCHTGKGNKLASHESFIKYVIYEINRILPVVFLATVLRGSHKLQDSNDQYNKTELRFND